MTDEHDFDDLETIGVALPEHVETVTTDSRGRLNLGTGFANKKLKIAVMKEEDLDE